MSDVSISSAGYLSVYLSFYRLLSGKNYADAVWEMVMEIIYWKHVGTMLRSPKSL
jgi:hypothetical protein